MTIINFLYGNNPEPPPAPHPQETALLLRLVGEWVSLISVRHQRATELAEELTEEGSKSKEDEECLLDLLRLHRETAADLEKLSALLKAEGGEQPLFPLLPPGGETWVRYTLGLFFEKWDPETADAHLWTLTRPVLCNEEGTNAKERKEAVSFYELTKLLIGAAHALHKESGGSPSA